MSFIIATSLFSIAALFIFISAFIRIKYLSKVHDYWNKGKSNTNSFANKLKHLSMKLAAAIGVLSVAAILSMVMFLALPVELEGMEYGVTGDELQTLRWKHEEFSESNFADFVNDYKKFGHSNVYDFAEARKLEIGTHSVFLEHKESMRQLQRDQEKVKLESERRTKEAKLQEERKAIEAERKRNSISNYSSSPSSSSSSFSSEDPRNVYIYCVTGKLGICFTTPAECEQQKLSYGGQCKSVACGTTEAALNTRQCAAKGFK